MNHTCRPVLLGAGATLLLVFLLAAPLAQAQIPFSVGSSGWDRARDVVYDGESHVFVIGNISGAADLDPGPGEFILTPIGERSGFVAKLTRAGELVWAFLITGSIRSSIQEIQVAPNGDIYVCGSVAGTVDFDPGLGNDPYTSLDDADSYVARYTSDGELVWAFGLPGLAFDAATSLSLDSDVNVYVTGASVGSADFDPGPGENILTSQSGRDLFIARYDSSGNLDWAHLFGAGGDDTGRGIVVNTDSSICVIADFHYSFDIDPGPGSAVVANDGSLDALIASFAFDGSYKWSFALSATGFSQFAGVVSDGDGNCYVSGWYSGSADFDPGSGVTSQTSHGDWDIVTAKYSASGSLDWVRSVGGPDQDRANLLGLGANGLVYTTGYFTGTVDFDPSAETSELVSRGETDAFVTVIDTAGTFVAAYRLGGALWDEGITVQYIDSTTVLVLGGFRGDISLAEDSLFSAGDLDAFVVRLTDLIPTDVTVDVRAFLEGPYTSGAMWPGVLHLAHVPWTQPFGSPDFIGTQIFYEGTESIDAVTDSLVDWVEIGLRGDPDASPDLARKAALLFRNGSIRDLDGISPVRFDHVGRNGYYVVVRHRNHVSVMSSDTLSTSDGFGAWDFRTSIDAGYSSGLPALNSLGGGVFGLGACDANADGTVTVPDFNLWNQETTAGLTGYTRGDCDLDGKATVTDFNLWKANTSAGLATQVPE